MNHLIAMRHLSTRSEWLRAPLALLYLWLGVAAAWHAPHKAEAAETAFQTSSSATPSLNADAFCALCSWQSLQQQEAGAAPAAVFSMSLAALPAPRAPDAPAPGYFPARWARGPPTA